MKLKFLIALSTALAGLAICQDVGNSTEVGLPDAELADIAANFDPDTYTPPTNARERFQISLPVSPNEPHSGPVKRPSNLTSRDTKPSLTTIYYTSSLGGLSGNPVVPMIIGQEGRHEFLQQARAFGLAAYAAKAQPNETTPAHYLKYSAGNFSFIVVASGAVDYNWLHFSRIAGDLVNFTALGADWADSNSSIIFTANDNLGTSQIYGALITSFRDEEGKSTGTDMSSTDGGITPGSTTGITPGIANGATTGGSTSSTTGGGRRRRRKSRDLQIRQSKNTYTLRFGPGRKFQLRLVAAATNVLYGVLAELITTSYNQLQMDTPSALIYSQQTSIDTAGLRIQGNIMEFKSDNGIHPDVYRAALQVMSQFAERYGWYRNAGLRPGFTAEIVDASGTVLGDIALGLKLLAKAVYCQVNNPDGSIVLGCLRKDEL